MPRAGLARTTAGGKTRHEAGITSFLAHQQLEPPVRHRSRRRSGRSPESRHRGLAGRAPPQAVLHLHRNPIDAAAHPRPREDRGAAQQRLHRHHQRSRALPARRPEYGAPGPHVTQPADRGTAAAVLLPLTAIYERDPEAAVMIFPCDHFVYPEGRFLEYVVATYRLCRRFRQSLVVLGAAPTSPETDYGWVMTEDPVGNGTSPLLQVGRFIEKPSPDEAKRMLRLGGFWSTMVVAARARTLWDLGWKVLPETDAAIRYVARRAARDSDRLVDRDQETDRRRAGVPTDRVGELLVRRHATRNRIDAALSDAGRAVERLGSRPSASPQRSVSSDCARRRRWLKPSDQLAESPSARPGRLARCRILSPRARVAGSSHEAGIGGRRAQDEPRF